MVLPLLIKPIIDNFGKILIFIAVIGVVLAIIYSIPFLAIWACKTFPSVSEKFPIICGFAQKAPDLEDVVGVNPTNCDSFIWKQTPGKVTDPLDPDGPKVDRETACANLEKLTRDKCGNVGIDSEGNPVEGSSVFVKSDDCMYCPPGYVRSRLSAGGDKACKNFTGPIEIPAKDAFRPGTKGGNVETFFHPGTLIDKVKDKVKDVGINVINTVGLQCRCPSGYKRNGVLPCEGNFGCVREDGFKGPGGVKLWKCPDGFEKNPLSSISPFLFPVRGCVNRIGKGSKPYTGAISFDKPEGGGTESFGSIIRSK